MGWDINQCASSRPFSHFCQPGRIHIQPFKYLFPEPAQCNMKKMDVGDIVICSDLVKIFTSLFSEMSEPFTIFSGHGLDFLADPLIHKNNFLKLLSGFHDRAQNDPFLSINAFNKHLPDFCRHIMQRFFRGLIFYIGIQIQRPTEIYKGPAIMSEKKDNFPNKARVIPEPKKNIGQA